MEVDIIEEELIVASESKARFSAAVWANKPQQILVLGAGGIGSWVSLILSRIGHTLIIYDMDIYETVNLAGQFVSNNGIGKPKAEALVEELKRFNDEGDFYFFNEKYEEESPATPIMFACFDNMTARQIAFDNWKKLEDRMIFIDGRLTAESYQVFVCYCGAESIYESTLFPDSEGTELPCSYKATTHTAMMIGAEMINCFNQYLSYGDCPLSISCDLISFRRNVDFDGVGNYKDEE